MQLEPASRDEQEEVRSYKPRVFTRYGKAHVPETFLNPSPYTRYRGLLQQLNNLQLFVDTRRGSKTRCPFGESEPANPTTKIEFWPTLDFFLLQPSSTSRCQLGGYIMIVPANKRVIKREDDYSLPTISKPGSTGDTNTRKEFPFFLVSPWFTKQFGVFTTVKAKIIE